MGFLKEIIFIQLITLFNKIKYITNSYVETKIMIILIKYN